MLTVIDVTISSDVLNADVLTAKTQLLHLVADADVRHVHFDSKHALFRALLPTTFWRLEQEGVIEQRAPWDVNEHGGGPYRMNWNGWAACVVEILEDTPTFAERKGQFCRAAKDALDRSGPPVQMLVTELATVAGLPVGWCWNAIRGNLFCRVKDAPRWGQLRYSDDSVTIPPTWGQDYRQSRS